MQDKSKIIGWLLILLIFVGYMVYDGHTRKNRAEQARLDQATEMVAQAHQDSIDAVKAQRESVEAQAEQTDSSNVFFAARQGKEGTTVIENDLLRLTIANRGGQLARAELKDKTYKSRTGGSVVLFDAKDATMKMVLDGKEKNLVTDDFCFTPTNVTKDGVTMSLPVGDGSLDISYRLHQGSYILDMDIAARGLADFFSAKTNQMTVVWNEKMKQQEKSYSFENRYSTITYRDTDGDTDELSSSGADKEKNGEDIDERLKWVAFKTQFFSQILIADSHFSVDRMRSAMAKKNSGYLKTLGAQLVTDFDPKGQHPTNFHMYLGPNKFSTLKANEKFVGEDSDLDLQSIVYLGWPVVRWINRFVFLYMFDFMTSWGINMGLVLLIITLIVKFAVYPLMRKSYLSSANMRVLKPKVEEIAKKYPNAEDAMQKNQETMQLYAQYGVSPMGGCLPMIIQMPIWIALFNFIPNAIELRGQSFLWSDDLSTYDDIIRWNTELWGIGNHLSLFCVLWCVSMVANTWISMRQQSYSMSSEQQQSMKLMRWFSYAMPFIFFFSFNDYAAGLNFYYFISGLISILMMWYLRHTTDDEKLLAKLEARFKERKSAGPSKRGGSLMERMQAMAEQQQEIVRRQKEEQERRNKK